MKDYSSEISQISMQLAALQSGISRLEQSVADLEDERFFGDNGWLGQGARSTIADLPPQGPGLDFPSWSVRASLDGVNFGLPKEGDGCFGGKSMKLEVYSPIFFVNGKKVDLTGLNIAEWNDTQVEVSAQSGYLCFCIKVSDDGGDVIETQTFSLTAAPRGCIFEGEEVTCEIPIAYITDGRIVQLHTGLLCVWKSSGGGSGDPSDYRVYIARMGCNEDWLAQGYELTEESVPKKDQDGNEIIGADGCVEQEKRYIYEPKRQILRLDNLFYLTKVVDNSCMEGCCSEGDGTGNCSENPEICYALTNVPFWKCSTGDELSYGNLNDNVSLSIIAGNGREDGGSAWCGICPSLYQHCVCATLVRASYAKDDTTMGCVTAKTSAVKFFSIAAPAAEGEEVLFYTELQSANEAKTYSYANM